MNKINTYQYVKKVIIDGDTIYIQVAIDILRMYHKGILTSITLLDINVNNKAKYIEVWAKYYIKKRAHYWDIQYEISNVEQYEETIVSKTYMVLHLKKL